MQFSKETQKSSIQSNTGKYAWRRKDVRKAIEELIENKYAILGGDVWLVDSLEMNQTTNSKIPQVKINVGTVQGKDGSIKVFNWFCDQNKKESWEDFIHRSKDETIKAIQSMHLESFVEDEYREKVYFNLVYVSEKEHLDLLQNDPQEPTTSSRGIIGRIKSIFK